MSIRLANAEGLKVGRFKGVVRHEPESMRTTYIWQVGKVCSPCADTSLGLAQNVCMDKTNHLRAWRKFRRLTLEEVAEKADTTKAVIQQLETGRLTLSYKWLLRIAPVLGTTPGFLLDHNPNDLDAAFLEAAMSVPSDRRKQALEILETFKTGTNG